MSDTETSETITKLQVGDREIILLGTAHVSRESVEEVSRVIREEAPGRVCVEIDAARYRTMTEGQNWEELNVSQVLRQRKGFLLLGNLVLSSFQRRIGKDLGVQPGEEMKAAIATAEELGIPFSFSDREINVTLRRAWSRSGFWGKNKMLAALFSSAITKEKLEEHQIEELKSKSALDGMMDELAGFLPSVKEVLIDERDRYLATKIYETTEDKVVAVVGAGHVKGITQWFEKLQEGNADLDLSSIETLPEPSKFRKFLPWLIPVVIFALLAGGVLRSGWHTAFSMIWVWIIAHGALSALGALLALAHPLTILIAFVASPITSLNPTIGVGIVTGIAEAFFRKPRVVDFENLHEDILSLRGFFRNRFTHILIVFFLSSIGSAIGTFIGIPYLTALLA
ncbi:MAG TPA: TraB/GumN family protein [Spirochaetia bacterium]|nr:TraB/GumN family protein [Spirochaetia bacterium]